MRDLDLRCKKCDSYLNLKGIQSIIAQVRCPRSKCKALNNVLVVTSESSDADIRFKFTEEDKQKLNNDKEKQV